MADATPTRLGALNGLQTTEDQARALYNDVLLASEIIATFEEKNKFLPLVWNRTLTKGKSATFPLIGKATAEYHTPGKEIQGQTINNAEQTITIDGKMISAVEISDLDVFMSEVEYRAPYTAELGRAMAKKMDINVAVEIIKSARADSPVTGGNDGTEIANDKFRVCTGGSSTLADKALALAEGLYQAAQTLDEKDVPEDGRVAYFRPADYYALVQNKDAIDQRWGGQGSYAEGNIVKIAGISINMSNHIPSTNLTTSDDTYHYVDASKTVGLVWVPQAVGVVKLMDLAMEAVWDTRRQVWLILAKMAVGMGPVNPSCAVELKLDLVTNATA